MVLNIENSAKSPKITAKKPLLAYQKQRLELAIDEISTPIFSIKTPMATPEIPYTIPKLVKGKRVTTVPKGSTLAKEEAKQSWYVEFFFNNAETDRMMRFRPTKNLNRLKHPKEKLKQFTRLCEAYNIA